MRTIKLIFVIPCILLAMAGCKVDNYAQPDATLQGALTDGEKGGALQLSEAGGGGTIRLIVNDPAKYPTPSNIDLPSIKADGTYLNTKLFAENYKALLVAQTGPWKYLAADTARITLSSGQVTTQNWKVSPYYYISTPTITEDAGGNLIFTFTVTKSTTAGVPAVDLTDNNNLQIYVNNYPIVDGGTANKGVGSYYQNQFAFTVKDAIVGAPYTPLWLVNNVAQTYSIPWANTHLNPGSYYFRVAILGHNSNGKQNWSPTVQFTVH